jgi:hypothetical protein
MILVGGLVCQELSDVAIRDRKSPPSTDVLGEIDFGGLHEIKMTDDPHVGLSETVFEAGFEWQHQHYSGQEENASRELSEAQRIQAQGGSRLGTDVNDHLEEK